MNTLPSISTLSDEGTSDDPVDKHPLLFRLHSCGSSHTVFRPKEKVLIASFYSEGLKECTHEKLFHRLTALEKTSVEENGDAVEQHITSWINENRKTSKF